VTEDRLYSDARLAQFYDIANGWGDDYSFCIGAAKNAQNVLDLGCGTGYFLTALPEPILGVGIEPATAMLDIARNRSGDDRFTWVEADARTVRLGQTFDLIVMTGHAFQVFLNDADQRAALATIAAHLSPVGRFIFDTRNPEIRAWETWRPEDSRYTFDHPDEGLIEAWNAATYEQETGVVTYETHYRIAATGEHLSAESQIRFSSLENLSNLMSDAGLHVDDWYGDWQGGPIKPNCPDFIPVGRLK